MRRRDAEPDLTDVLQDYLEAVYGLVQRDRVARMRDIAKAMGVGKSSATGAIQHLAEHGFVNYGAYQYVTLTRKGEVAGRQVAHRHEVLKKFLMDMLAVPQADAERIGCKMEHALEGEAFRRFVRFLSFVERRCATDRSWLPARRRSAAAGKGR